jgi:hypothetical protein
MPLFPLLTSRRGTEQEGVVTVTSQPQDTVTSRFAQRVRALPQVWAQ